MLRAGWLEEEPRLASLPDTGALSDVTGRVEFMACTLCTQGERPDVFE